MNVPHKSAYFFNEAHLQLHRNTSPLRLARLVRLARLARLSPSDPLTPREASGSPTHTSRDWVALLHEYERTQSWDLAVHSAKDPTQWRKTTVCPIGEALDIFQTHFTGVRSLFRAPLEP